MPGDSFKTRSNFSTNTSPATPEAVPSGSLTRSKVAERLGVSLTTLRRMEGKQLHPQTGPGGVRLFDSMEVESVSVKMRKTGDPDRAMEEEGEMAAEALGLFDEGLNPVDVVIRTKFLPQTVQQIHRWWIEMRSHLVITDMHRNRIEKLLLADKHRPGEWKLKNGYEVYQAIVKIAEDKPCSLCEKDPAAVCHTCATKDL